MTPSSPAATLPTLAHLLLAVLVLCWSPARAEGDGFDDFDVVTEPAPPPKPRARRRPAPPPPVDSSPPQDEPEAERAQRSEEGRKEEGTAKAEPPARREEKAEAPPAPPPAVPEPARPAVELAGAPAPGGVPAGRAVPVEDPLKGAPPVPKEVFDSVTSRLAAGDNGGAAAAVRKALEREPESPRLKQLAMLLERRVRSGEEAPLAGQAAALMGAPRGPGQAPPPALASGLTWPAGDAAAAARAAAALPRASQDFLRRNGADEGLVKLGLKDFSAAEAALTERLRQDPEDWKALRLRALARRSLGKPEGALEDAARALALNPRDGRSHGVRAMAYSDLGRHHEAAAAADAALALDRRDAGAYAARARAREGLGLNEQSLADLRTASELDPRFEALYREAMGAEPPGAPAAPASRRGSLALGAAGLALLAAAAALFRRRAALTRGGTAPPMRVEDRLSSGPVLLPDEAPGYRIRRELGQGGMGVVYEAYDETLQRVVALKRLREDLAADPKGRKRFLKEARLVASLKHPHIVEIHSVVELGPRLFLVFEFVPGSSLDHVLSARSLEPREALEAVRQTASALDYAHAQGVTHQDLKPANILVSTGLVKVTDFGIARRLSDATTTMTSRLVAGTPAYMAPEQVRGLREAPADLYALALCAYEMLSRVRPFDGDPTFARRLRGDYRPLSELVPGIPPAADPVIARALDPEPSRRHPSASAFAQDLARAFGPG